MDLRKEAEARALQREKTDSEDQNRRSSFRIQQRQLLEQKRQSIQNELQVNQEDYSSQINDTPKIAQLAEIDYKWNGARARAHNDNFIIPRWVPDEEIAYCHACNSEFDYINRKHHCRHCGMVYCHPCSENRALVPHEFGYKDPVRVCNDCHKQLLPQQQYLSTNIANHQRINNIDVASTNCNVRRYMNMPFSSTLGSEIRKAAYSTHNLFSQAMYFVRDKAIPLGLLANAKGLAFLTVLKGGFVFAPRIGTGLVIARLPETADPSLLAAGGGWSAPSAIGTVGVSWGAVIGLDVTDYVIILNTAEAVQAFSGLGQISIGAGIEVAVGPVGRSGSADFHIADTGLAPAFSYSHSRGLFAGVSLDGSLIMARSEVNHCFYGRPVSPLEILSGSSVPPPRAAAPLYDALQQAMASLPDVQHVHVKHNKRQSGVYSPTPTTSTAGALGQDHTQHALQSIDDVLSNSGLHSSTTSSTAGETALNSNSAHIRDSNRRRTMAHLPPNTEHSVHHDEVWGAGSGYNTSSRNSNGEYSSSQQRPQYTPFVNEPLYQHDPLYQFAQYARTTSQDTGYAEPAEAQVPQRKARPQSLPANINAAYQHDMDHAQGQRDSSEMSGEDCLADVPRPVYTTASAAGTVGAGSSANVNYGANIPGTNSGKANASGKSVIDEELECVTANLNMML